MEEEKIKFCNLCQLNFYEKLVFCPRCGKEEVLASLETVPVSNTEDSLESALEPTEKE